MTQTRGTIFRFFMIMGACVAVLGMAAIASPRAVHAANAQANPSPSGTIERSFALAAVAATFAVNNMGDAGDANIGDGICATSGGVCTLRAALDEANATPAMDMISFNIAGGGPHSIMPASALVATQPVIIDGTTQPGASCAAWPPVLQIELRGDSPTLNGAGGQSMLTIAGGNSIVRGLVINRMSYTGDGYQDDALALASNNNRVECNYVGTDVTGTTALPNETGVALSGSGNIVGTNSDGVNDANERNLISGNTAQIGYGINISGSNHVIAGNMIGTTPDGLSALGNSTGIDMSSATGVLIGTNGDGISDSLERNIISGNPGSGISLSYNADTNRIAGNYVGTNLNGSAALGNGYGIYLTQGSDANIIGTNGDGTGDSVEGNIISGNNSYSIYIGAAASPTPVMNGNVIAGNRIGLDVSGAGMPNFLGILIGENTNNTRIGTNGDGVSDTLERNYISSNTRGGISLGANPFYGIQTNTMIAGNYIGLGLDGMTNRGNKSDGVYVQYAVQNLTIGTNGDGNGDAVEGNVISYNNDGFCNGANGIRMRGIGYDQTYNIRIAGNKIGTTADGLAAAANANSGISIDSGARDITIGTNGDGVGDAFEGNLISGHMLNNGSCFPASERAGVVIDGSPFAPNNTSSHHVTIAGNKIGTNISGTAAIANMYGVVIRNGSSGNIIGTNGDGMGDAAEGNLISGNSSMGISLSSVPSNVVAGNIIGLQADGSAPLGNGSIGIQISGSNPGTLVGTNNNGTSDPLERNVIAAHTSRGIQLMGASGVLVQGNDVGTRSDGTDGGVGNLVGIGAEGGSTGNQIGTSAVGNRIAYNMVGGVLIAQSSGNMVAGNTVLNNANYGIQNDRTESSAPGDGPGDNIITQNAITQNGFGISNIGSSPTITGNTISANGQSGVFNAVFIGNDASPATASDDVLSRPQIATNSFSNNCAAAGASSCASIYSLDTMPANEATLEADNTFASVAAGHEHVRQSWYGAVEIMQSGTPVAASATVNSSNSGPSYTMNNTNSCSGVLNNTIIHGINASLNCANFQTWTELTQYVVDASGTRISYVPQSTTAPSATTYSFDGDGATNPTNTGAGFNAEGIQTGPFLRYQVMELSQPVADLQITKTDGVTSVVAGTSTTYTINVTNNGPNAVSGADLIDNLPTNLTGATWTCAPAAACSSASGTGDINLSLDLANGATAIITVNGTVAASAQGMLSNTATIATPAGMSDPNSGNDSVTDTDTITSVADVSITKTDGVTTVTAGNAVTYTITVANNGPSDASSVTVSDVLPTALTGATWTCAPTAGATCTSGGSGNINQTISLPAGGSAFFTVNATVKPDARGTLTNTATASSTASDPTPGNNTATDTDQITASADLALSKTTKTTVATPDDTIVYTLAYNNAGPSSATGVVINETVPANTTFDAAGSTTGWSCTNGAAAGTACTFTIGNLAAASNGTVAFAVKVNNPLSASVSQINNTATINDDGTIGPDPVPGNNSASATTPVYAAPDPVLDMTDGGVTATPGNPITYTLIYTNSGNQDAVNAVINEEVPANTTFDPAASTPGWACTPDSNAGSTCLLNMGTIAAGASGSVTFVVMVDNPLPTGVVDVTNAANIYDDNGDSNDGNNSATVTTPVNAAPDMAIQIDDHGVTAKPGGTITYTLTYQNVGNKDASGVVLTAVVPDNTTFRAGASSSGWSCADGAPAGTVCTFTVGALGASVAPGNVSFAVMVIDPLPASVTQIMGAASIADDGTNGTDPVTSNNSAHVTTRLAPTAIDLLYFRAAQQNGHVLLAWATAAEKNVLGFHIYRSTDGTRAHAVRVTTALISAKGRDTGATYQWEDGNTSTSATYWLEEVQLDSTTNEYGPAKVANTPSALPHTIFLPLAIR